MMSFMASAVIFLGPASARMDFVGTPLIRCCLFPDSFDSFFNVLIWI